MKKPTLQDYFHFSRKERFAIIVLVVFISFAFFANEMVVFFKKEKAYLVVPPYAIKDTILTANKTNTRYRISRNKEKAPAQKLKISPIQINAASAEELAVLPGIGPVLSKRIIKFRNSKKGFLNVVELNEVYGLSPETYALIREYIIVTPLLSKENIRSSVEAPSSKPLIKVDINLADSATFTLLRGLGPVLSARIVKYRRAKGGFDSIGEVKRIYGISEELYAQISTSLVLLKRATVSSDIEYPEIKDSVEEYLLDLDINTITVTELEKIRGIGPYFANAIVGLRENLSGYATLDQLKSIHKIEDDTYILLTNNVSIKSAHKRFNINEIEFGTLLRMQILNYKEVKYIFNLKKVLGKITSFDQINNLQGISQEKKALLFEYLDFEN